MEAGIKNSLEITVTKENTALSMGSGSLEVFATPAMISLIEGCCYKCVTAFLEEGQSTVGTKLEIEHLAPTPIGMKVTCNSTLVEVDGRRLVFEVEVFDSTGIVGKGKHERFIINSEKFMAKANSKLD